jgi:hypothetical protein
MSNLKSLLASAIHSETHNDRLQMAASMAGEYLRARETAQQASAAAAQFAAELLGIQVSGEARTGQATARGLDVLIRKNPIQTILLAVAKQDRQLKQDLYWALDASRRSAAVAAHRSFRAKLSHQEASDAARDILLAAHPDQSGQYESDHCQPDGDTGYAGSELPDLYPSSGQDAKLKFLADSEIWEALALLLSTEADVPRLCRFWTVSGRDFVPVNCDSWEDVESFLAERN